MIESVVAFAAAAASGRVEGGDGAARDPLHAHRRTSGHRITSVGVTG